MPIPGTTSITVAAKLLNRTPQTIRRWCADKNFGVRIGGRWEIPDANINRIDQAIKRADGEVVR